MKAWHKQGYRGVFTFNYVHTKLDNWFITEYYTSIWNLDQWLNVQTNDLIDLLFECGEL